MTSDRKCNLTECIDNYLYENIEEETCTYLVFLASTQYSLSIYRVAKFSSYYRINNLKLRLDINSLKMQFKLDECHRLYDILIRFLLSNILLIKK